MSSANPFATPTASAEEPTLPVRRSQSRAAAIARLVGAVGAFFLLVYSIEPIWKLITVWLRPAIVAGVVPVVAIAIGVIEIRKRPAHRKFWIMTLLAATPAILVLAYRIRGIEIVLNALRVRDPAESATMLAMGTSEALVEYTTGLLGSACLFAAVAWSHSSLCKNAPGPGPHKAHSALMAGFIALLAAGTFVIGSQIGTSLEALLLALYAVVAAGWFFVTPLRNQTDDDATSYAFPNVLIAAVGLVVMVLAFINVQTAIGLETLATADPDLKRLPAIMKSDILFPALAAGLGLGSAVLFLGYRAISEVSNKRTTHRAVFVAVMLALLVGGLIAYQVWLADFWQQIMSGVFDKPFY